MKPKYTIQTMVWAAVLLMLLIPTGCKDRESIADTNGNSGGPPAIPVSVVEVKPVAMHDVVYLPGETEAYEDVKVAANTSGRVEWIGPREGLARFISAIRLIPSATRASEKGRPRGAGPSAAAWRRSRGPGGHRARTDRTSSRAATTIPS